MFSSTSSLTERRSGSPIFVSWMDQLARRMAGGDFSSEFGEVFNSSKDKLPQYKISKTTDKLGDLVEICVPGYTKEQLKVKFNEVEKGFKTTDTARLVVSGVQPKDVQTFIGSFDFTLDLPIGTTFKEAKLENGILRIMLNNPPVVSPQQPKFVNCQID